MFFRKKAGKGGTYLQLVESYREEGRVRQRVLLTLGRLEEMKALGRLDALLASGSRLSQEVMVLSARMSRDTQFPAVGGHPVSRAPVAIRTPARDRSPLFPSPLPLGGGAAPR